MKIVIHGTKGGYHIFTPEKVKMIDARPDFSKVATIGQRAYAINFSDGNLVFSSYKIIRDVIGDKRTGHVAFSVVLPNNQKLSGVDVKKLLDHLSFEYCHSYITGDNLDDVREDWSFVNTLTNEYESKCQILPAHEIESAKQGSNAAAFIYYSSNEDLQKYFETPYQEEYSSFEQIFFVESGLQGKDKNPLNALRHDPTKDLTGKIDLETPKYKLQEFYGTGINNITIEIWVNQRQISNYGLIDANDDIRLIYSKNKYFSPIDESGKLTDVNISKYLTVNKENKITVKKDVKLLEKIEEVSLKTHDKIGNEIYGVTVVCKNATLHTNKKVENGKITFGGEELRDTWVITARKGDLIAQPVTIVPESSDRIVYLVLEEKKINEPKNPVPATQAPTTTNQPPVNYHKSRYYNKPVFIVGILVGIISMLGLVAYFFDPTGTEDDASTMLEYIEGIELQKDKIESFRQKYCASDHRRNNEIEKAFWQDWFSSSSAEEDYTDYCLKITNALSIRSAISQGNIDSLRNKNYSRIQSKFKDSVNKIDDKFKSKIGAIISAPDLSKISLTEIANIIDNLQKLLKIRESVKTMADTEALERIKEEIVVISLPTLGTDSIKINIKNEIHVKMQESIVVASRNTEKVRPGSGRSPSPQTPQTISTLATPQPTTPTRTPGSFEKEFWEIVHSEAPKVDAFKDWQSKYSYNADNKGYKNFYVEHLDNEQKVKKLLNIPDRERKRVSSLPDLKNLIDKHNQK